MAKSFLLCVQGEGRGHLSQALTIYDLLISQGHSVCAIIVGSTGTRVLPAYFIEKIKVPLYKIDSPNFVNDKAGKGIVMGKTVIANFKHLGKFRRSLRTIGSVINTHQPDMVINFFDLLTGVYFRLNKPRIPLLSIAHQYIYFHPDFTFPKGNWFTKFFLKQYTRLTTSSSAKNLALSFYNLPTTTKNVTVVPPLLRKEILQAQHETNNHFLVYLVNSGYFEEILNWHYEHPDQMIHCFTDNAEALKHTYAFNHDVVCLHEPNDTLFIEYLRTAKGLATTAGFESVCEAMYLGKPVLMVPLKGHYEQFCNSRDGVRAGAGVYADSFNLNKLDSITIVSSSHHNWFKNWADTSRTIILTEIEHLLDTSLSNASIALSSTH